MVLMNMVKIMNCHAGKSKVQETVSEEAEKDQWGVHSIDKVHHIEKSD